LTSSYMFLKRKLLGKPIPTDQEHTTRLSKKIALPVFSSDAISSTAYATEEILVVLVAAGVTALRFSVPIAIAVAALLTIVVLSYEQTVHAYPNGGGSYIVGSENLGMFPGLVAGSALLVDYVMTVAVSVAAGTAALTSAFPQLFQHRVLISVLFVLLVAVANLRGLRESGMLFSLPTYSFVVLCGGLIVVGLARQYFFGGLTPAVIAGNIEVTKGLGTLLILRAFSAGCTAMTGTEAISNGVPAFKPPESRNAGITLGFMGGTLGTLLIGITWIAHIIHVVPRADETVLSQIGRSVYGSNGVLYFALQIATMAILVVAAQTSFADFPRLSSILARDGFMPRQFANRGDRLVFSNGIIGLAVISMLIIVIFRADVNRMIPLYAVGVFTSFTISQAGMVVHWRRLRAEVRGWFPRALMNGFGAVLTAVVSVVVMVTKFPQGAWIVLIAIPTLVLIFYGIHRHYKRIADFLVPMDAGRIGELRVLTSSAPRTTVVLFVSQVNEMTARSLYFAKAFAPDDTHVVTVKSDESSLKRLEDQWTTLDMGVELEVLDSPFRELVRPAVGYVRGLAPSPSHMVIVVIPEFVVAHWWEAILHNQNALRLKGALLLVPYVVVVSIPFHVLPDGEILEVEENR
jgi:amino acid transporter